jgi:hypothetical protein
MHQAHQDQPRAAAKLITDENMKTLQAVVICIPHISTF